MILMEAHTGRTNNLTIPAIKEVSIFVYGLVMKLLPAEFEDIILCRIVALAAAAVRSSFRNSDCTGCQAPPIIFRLDVVLTPGNLAGSTKMISLPRNTDLLTKLH